MPISTSDVLSIAAAVLLAGVGGEIFLKGILGIAAWLRISKLLVATTLAAFATSSPEFTVSSIAALSGKPEIGLGDALGSNVVNIALVFGLALLFGPIRAGQRESGRDFVLALTVPLLIWWLAADGTLTRPEGGLLLLVFAAWTVTLIRAGARERRAATPAGESNRPAIALAYGVGGLLALMAAGRLFVAGASNIAGAFGVDVYVIGATLVAIGTSLPELVTVLLARLRGHDEVGIGTLLGSNLFNGLAIVGVAASIHPIRTPPAEVVETIVFGMVAVLMAIPNRAGVIPRSRGLLLLATYACFVLATLATGRALSG